MLLTNEQVAKWEKQWGAGKTWTQAEQEAAANTTKASNPGGSSAADGLPRRHGQSPASLCVR